MDLQLANVTSLRLFPPDDDDDVPRYSVQKNTTSSERFINMIPEDELHVEEENGKKVVKIGKSTVGYIDSEESAKTEREVVNEEKESPKKNKNDKKGRKKPVGYDTMEHSPVEGTTASKTTSSSLSIDKFLEEWNKCLEFVTSKDSGSITRDRTMTPSLRKHLVEQESEFLEDRDVTFRFLTWNLCGDPIYTTKEDLTSLFVDPKGEKLDLYFVALQEVVPLNAKNFRSSQIPVNNWITRIINILDPEEYAVLQTNKLLGLASILICRTSLAINFHDLDISSIGTGILNIYGNKGAIATSFKINDRSFTMLDCHFAAGESDQFIVKRRRELQGIKNYIKLPHAHGSLMSEDASILFDVDEIESAMKAMDVESDEEDVDEEAILGDLTTSETKDDGVIMNKTRRDSVVDEADRDKSVVFIGGDLNYRIKTSREAVDQLIQAKDYRALLDLDALTIEKDQGRILQDYTEGLINFPPTYKIDVETKEFEQDRRPSYTDRVFHSKSQYVTINSYQSPDIVLSDHRPVYTDYTLHLPIINNDKRQTIVTSFLKHMDDQENNAKRTTLEIDPLEPHILTRILSPTKLQVKVRNVGNCKTYWEILDSVDSIDSKIPISQINSRIEPRKGVLPKNATQTLTITTTLPIGCRKLTKMIVMRSYSSQDHFITATFEAKPSYFGSTIDELHSGQSSGIPKPIYSLINYLTQNIRKDMFDESKLNFTHDLEKKVIQWVDEDKDLDSKELQGADDILEGSSITAIARVLLLLLRNLDGGIVSEDLATYLLVNFKGDSEILEKILEHLPPLRANVLIYLCSFLRLCVEHGIDKVEIAKKFENLLIEVPQRRKRDVMLGRTNYEKLRSEFLEKLVG